VTVPRRLDPTIVREYDIRGVVGRTLTAADAYAVGRAFGSLVADGGGSRAAVGYDGRLSSPELERALAGGLSDCGLTVVRAGLGPTPMLYFATVVYGCDAGVMVTGSHNPPEYNGLKLTRGGKPFWGADIVGLADRAATGPFAAGAGTTVDRPALDAYVERLLTDYREGRRLRVAWDPGNGAAGEAVKRLTRRLPGDHLLLNAEIDGTFPAHHPDPTVEKNLAQLKEAVVGAGLDLGFAFDGDGDRIGVVDGRGRTLWGDQVLIILAEEVLKERPGATVIADVKASRVLFDEIRRMGGTPLMWRTGHSPIKAKMRETGAPLAGEMSAHIIFADRYYGFDDALYAAVRLLSIVARSETSLAAMLDRLPRTHNTPEIRFPCPEERKFGVVAEVRDRLSRLDGVIVHDIDGVRVEDGDGWWLLRASNTQAVLVARCESDTPAGLERLKAALARELAASGLAVPEFG
jgi:phosphomannomutase